MVIKRCPRCKEHQFETILEMCWKCGFKKDTKCKHNWVFIEKIKKEGTIKWNENRTKGKQEILETLRFYCSKCLHEAFKKKKTTIKFTDVLKRDAKIEKVEVWEDDENEMFRM